MTGRNTVVIRIAVIVGVLGLLAWFFVWNTSRIYQFEVVHEGVLYRTSARDDKEFVSAAIKVYPQGLVIVGTTAEFEGGPLSTARNYGHKNRTRVLPMTVNAGEAPSAEQLTSFMEYAANPRRQPALMVDTDGRAAGMLAAAYRLKVLKLPLEEVLQKAALKDSPPETVEAVRNFARHYAEVMDHPASVPVTAPPATQLPLGPSLPE